ncbi:MAG: hypothetical protein V3R89_07535 [Thermoanaerobaculia bacterium]
MVKEVLLPDQVLATGDASFRKRRFERYRQLRDQGVTVLLGSHEPKIVSRFCDRAILLEGGLIVMDHRPDRVAEDYSKLLGWDPSRGEGADAGEGVVWVGRWYWKWKRTSPKTKTPGNSA